MKYRIIKPEIPVIWLDTYAINEIASALLRPPEKRTSRDHYALGVYEQLLNLVKQKKALCFESDQLSEIKAVPGLLDKVREVLTRLSNGVRTSYLNVEQEQVANGIRHFIQNDSDEPVLDWQAVFPCDPFKAGPVGGFITRVKSLSQGLEDGQREERKAFADVLEKLRTERVAAAAAGISEKLRRERQLERELGVYQAIYRDEVARWLSQPFGVQAHDEETFLRLLNSISRPLILWKHYGGEEDALRGLYNFYGSEHYKTLPYISISSEMWAHLLVAGQAIRPSDVMDVRHISTFLPYCHVMVIDGSMIELVKTKLGLGDRYRTELVKFSGLRDLLKEIEVN